MSKKVFVRNVIIKGLQYLVRCIGCGANLDVVKTPFGISIDKDYRLSILPTPEYYYDALSAAIRYERSAKDGSLARDMFGGECDKYFKVIDISDTTTENSDMKVTDERWKDVGVWNCPKCAKRQSLFWAQSIIISANNAIALRIYPNGLSKGPLVLISSDCAKTHLPIMFFWIPEILYT
jgi:hypothetical protein